MQLPGRLDTSTLGDILGTLYRGNATGVLELSEVPVAGSVRPLRSHRIHLLSGLVASVETGLDVTPIGEILARAGKVDRRAIDVMLYRMAIGDPRPAGAILVGMGAVSQDALLVGLRGQLRAKINAIYLGIGEARITFRTSRPLPKDALRVGTLLPRDFLHGRPRKRDRRRAAAAEHTSYSCSPPPAPQRPWWSSARPGYEGQGHDTPLPRAAAAARPATPSAPATPATPPLPLALLAARCRAPHARPPPRRRRGQHPPGLQANGDGAPPRSPHGLSRGHPRSQRGPVRRGERGLSPARGLSPKGPIRSSPRRGRSRPPRRGRSRSPRTSPSGTSPFRSRCSATSTACGSSRRPSGTAALSRATR